MDLIAKKVDKPKTILLAPTLVVRESTGGATLPRPKRQRGAGKGAA
jgi:hypothetical protein